jgi:hypothetical protein
MGYAVSDEPRPLAPGALPLADSDLEIVQPLGRVGDGLVYYAQDGDRQARLREYAPVHAVRRLPGGTFEPSDPRLTLAWEDGAARFLALGHRLASIDHPNIAPIWRASGVEADGVRQGAYWVGAAVGEPLSVALEAGLRLAPAAILQVAGQLADALAEVHKRGLAHLDVSPETVSVAGGRLELTDFAVDNRAYIALLGSDEGLVRPGYSPIEHHDASMAEPLGPRADVYAASALLYRLVTGRDPASWQDRWRDPAAGQLPDDDHFPPDFLATIRRGMAIEPQDRFRDAAEWRDAMALLTVAPAAPAPVEPARTPPPPVSEHPVPLPADLPASTEYDETAIAPDARRRWSKLPLLLLLALLVIGIGGYFAYTQNWFVPADPGPSASSNKAAPRKSAERPRRASDSAPTIEPGASVSGQLAPGDRRRGGGQFEDRFTLNGNQGDRLELRLSSTAFDPLINVTGPGFEAANDDDRSSRSRDARLLVTLPRAGRYTVAVTSYARGGTGDYLLQVQTARPALSVATPVMLTGRWRQPQDVFCATAAAIRVEGGELVIEYRGAETREQILDGVGRVIRTRRPAGERGYRLNDEGTSFELDGRTWMRC